MADSLLIMHAAAVLGVSRRTIYYWIHNGKLTVVSTRGGSKRVTMESIAQVLAAREAKYQAAGVLGTALFARFRAP